MWWGIYKCGGEFINVVDDLCTNNCQWSFTNALGDINVMD